MSNQPSSTTLVATTSTHDSFFVDESQPKNRNLLVWGIVILIVFGLATWILTSIFYRTLDDMIHAKVLEPPSVELQTLRTQQREWLHSYGFVDKEKQIFHIPIEEAIKKEAMEAQQRRNP